MALIAALSCLICRAQSHAAPKPRIDRIIVVKSTRTMTLMSGGKIFKTYRVALGTVPMGPKEQHGDHKTPEGDYFVQTKIPNRRFHKALLVSYPNAADRARARKMGVNPGGEIEIHGLGSEFGWLGALHRKADWTDGCIAVTNEEIDEIYPLVEVSTPIEIRP